MKRMLYIFIFFQVFLASAQIPTNRPEIVEPVIRLFKMDAEIRGIEVEETLSRIDSIVVKPYRDFVGAEAISYANGHWKIIINESELEKESSAFRASNRITLYHELGHVFGINDCGLCNYNIMAATASKRAAYLYRDAYLRLSYHDRFFEALRNPGQYNKIHNHY